MAEDMPDNQPAFLRIALAAALQKLFKSLLRGERYLDGAERKFLRHKTPRLPAVHCLLRQDRRPAGQ
jgi:hypothetical protein